VATATPRKLVNLVEAGEYLGVHQRTVRRYISEGRLKGYQVGPRLVKVDQADLDAVVRRIPTASR
jgi:excisionase family DNA binding protein